MSLPQRVGQLLMSPLQLLRVPTALRRFLGAVIDPPTSRSARALPPTAWAAFIFILSSLPGSAYPEVRFPHADKFVHAFLYLPLGFWLVRALGNAPLATDTRSALIAFAIGAAYGMSDEIHQLFVPQRSFSLLDWTTDCLAVAAGIILWYWRVRRFAHRSARREGLGPSVDRERKPT